MEMSPHLMTKSNVQLWKSLRNSFLKIVMLLPAHNQNRTARLWIWNYNQCQAFAEVKSKRTHKMKETNKNQRSGHRRKVEISVRSYIVGNQADLKISWKSFQSSLLLLLELEKKVYSRLRSLVLLSVFMYRCIHKKLTKNTHTHKQ